MQPPDAPPEPRLYAVEPLGRRPAEARVVQGGVRGDLLAVAQLRKSADGRMQSAIYLHLKAHSFDRTAARKIKLACPVLEGRLGLQN